MSTFHEMWDWDNLMMFSSSKVVESIEMEGVGSFNLSENGRSGSDSQVQEPSGTSVEQLLGLKLGKRTYFGDGKDVKSPCSVIPGKKTKIPSNVFRCQVEGCNLDLCSAKEYHRKHRVCDNHSKSPKVVINGLERRFCQQCSRFHNLCEFDEKKRSCRRRLSDHNARRRKPQQETIQFHSSRISSSFYDGTQQMNFMVNGGNSEWVPRTQNSKFTITTQFPLKPIKTEGITFEPQLSATHFSHGFNMHSSGFKDPVIPDFRHALSLLSNNSSSTTTWGPLTSNTDHNTNTPVLHGVPQGSSDYWVNQSTYPRVGQTLNFEENQYESAFYQ